MKTNFKKAGLRFGLTMSLFFIAQQIILSANYSFKGIAISVASGLVGGAVSGLLFGLILKLMFKNKGVEQAMAFNPDEDEQILLQSPANHFHRWEAVGGMLYLTNKRLVFMSHNLNIQNHWLTIDTDHITHVSRRRTMGLINNGLVVNTRNSSDKFVVQQPKKWLEMLSGKSISSQVKV